MIVATIGEKGGTGKTTLATNLAGMRAAHSDVVIVDADRQGTATLWVEEREARDLAMPSCVPGYGASLLRIIRDMALRYTDVIVDVASGDSMELQSALSIAQVAILPVQPSAADVWTIGHMDWRVEDALVVNDELAAFAVINKASPNPRAKDADRARQGLSEAKAISVGDCPTVHERMVFKRAIEQGRTVWECRPRDKRACWETAEVYKLVFNQRYEDGG